MRADLEVQRTVKRAEQTAFRCLLKKKVVGPINVHVDNKGIIDGYGEEQESASNQKLEVLTGGSRFGKNCTVWPQEILWRVKAHRTKRDRKEMSQFEKFVANGSEKADEVAKAGPTLDKGFMSAETVQQEREEVYAALQDAASFHCLVGEGKDCEELEPKPKERRMFVDMKSEETRHRTEWCVEANKYRCMSSGWSRKFLKMPWKCEGPKYVSENLKKWESDILESHDRVRRVHRQGEVLI